MAIDFPNSPTIGQTVSGDGRTWSWHDTVCAALGIPHPNRNAATSDIDPDAQWTLRYTDVAEVAADDWRAFVEDDIAAVHPDGLGQPCDPPSFPDIDP